jgi:hypothetical protein
LSQRKWFLTGLAVTLLAVQACGSDDGKKRVRSGEAGGAGEAGAMEPDSGGSGAGVPSGSAGERTEGGTGGMPGSAGEPEVTGGTGGEPDPGPQPELLFTVKPEAIGVEGTGLFDAATKENFIYASQTASLDRVAGSNEVKITGADLGLDPSDQIVSFTLLQPAPANPLYLFSIQDGGEGGYSLGYNGLSSSSQSLGLYSGGGEAQADDLTGLAVHDANKPIDAVYFVVRSGSSGAAGSAVTDTTAADQGCTIFKSTLDGTNETVFTCAQLGLAPDDQLDALALYGSGAPTQVVFSVASGSVGADGTAVATTLAGSYDTPASLFESSGNAMNALLKTPNDLGLDGYYDDIDALAVIDVPQPTVQAANTCQVTYDPFAAAPDGGELDYYNDWHHIGSNVFVLFGHAPTTGNRLLAYDATTCAFLQQKDMPAAFDSTGAWAIVPLAGWSAAKPLDKVEYYRIDDNMDLTGQDLHRLDENGENPLVFPLNGTYAFDSVGAMLYEPGSDQLYAVLDLSYGYDYHRLVAFQRPTADTAVTLDTTGHDLFLPCSLSSAITGVDAAGNVFFAERQDSDTDYRVCGYRPDGELVTVPYWWSGAATTDYAGFIVPGSNYFLVSTGSPVEFERSTFTPP